jgi:hypothetical protein
MQDDSKPTVPYWHLWTDSEGVSHQSRCLPTELEAMVKFASAVSGSGNAPTTTVRGYTPDEFSKLAAEAPTL